MLARLPLLLGLAVIGIAGHATAEGPIDLDVLYIGNAETPRAEAFESLLAEHHELGAILWIGATDNPKRFRYRLVEGPRAD